MIFQQKTEISSNVFTFPSANTKLSVCLCSQRCEQVTLSLGSSAVSWDLEECVLVSAIQVAGLGLLFTSQHLFVSPYQSIKELCSTVLLSSTTLCSPCVLLPREATNSET